MVILRSQNKITDFFTILAWLSRFNYHILSEWRKHVLLSRGVQKKLFLIFIIIIIILTTQARY